MSARKKSNKDQASLKSEQSLKVKQTPTSGELPKNDFPIVGIGASAGGLAAFEAFFSGLSANAEPNMAFILVQHLAPDHKSILAELLQKHTKLEVLEVEDNMQVRINCAYIIPPNCEMAFLNGALQLLEPSEPHGHRLPIDFLFRSLAQNLHQRAIGIVLTGTGSDGTLGVRAIKAEGGMVMVQSVDACEFDGMPRSAVATGLVDYEMDPVDMPAQLTGYVEHAFGKLQSLTASQDPLSENLLNKIFVILRNQTGNDFSQYKPNTIYRRIERRMAVHQIKNIENYVKYLQKTPTEVEALFRDLLIGVTSFFRDPEAFEVLEQQVIPKLFKDKPLGAVVRVWCAGCSTGEETYSLAILIQEHLEQLKKNIKVQIFATDIDSRAIAAARKGRYANSISKDISAVRLERFFNAEPGGDGYRVHKNIRDMLVFSEHNIVKDPPFSKLDFISCRNLLIYMNSDLQKRVITLFHYALKPTGMMFLGTSETVGQYGYLFTALDRKAKIYQRKEDFQGEKRAALNRFLPPSTAKQSAKQPISSRAFGAKLSNPMKLSLRELTEKTLLDCIAPACVLVNGLGDIFYLHGRTGMYLEPAPGEAGINNILKMAREGLKLELTTSLYKCATSKEQIRLNNLRVKTNGHFSAVNLTICPVIAASSDETTRALESPLFLVVLEEARQLESSNKQLETVSNNNDKHAESNSKIAELNEELQAKDEYLHAANEELETANEELKSSNEEMQSVNEELQSTNEELETSKEELQSINEELTTVNTELQTKLNDLSRVNNDMNNLLAGTGIGTVFVDHSLLILRFTPSATLIINLMQGDVGRPVGHISSNLIGYDSFVSDVQNVLKTLVAKETNVQTTKHKWYTMRILPYRTLDNIIEGAVITFVDITEMVRIREALKIANEKMLALEVKKNVTG